MEKQILVTSVREMRERQSGRESGADRHGNDTLPQSYSPSVSLSRSLSLLYFTLLFALLNSYFGSVCLVYTHTFFISFTIIVFYFSF